MHWINSTRQPHSVRSDFAGVQHYILLILQYLDTFESSEALDSIWTLPNESFWYNGTMHSFLACFQHCCNLLQHCNVMQHFATFQGKWFLGFSNLANPFLALSGRFLFCIFCAAMCAPGAVHIFMRLAGCVNVHRHLLLHWAGMK